jgi:hypothetical protein
MPDVAIQSPAPRTSSGLVEWLERRHVPGVNAGGGLPETLVNALTT